MDTLELLLKTDIPNLPEKEVKLMRLSEICKGDIVFKLRAMSYNRTAEIKKSAEDDMNVHIILAGTVEPNLKDADLMAKYKAPTPAELVKVLLLPGEIDDIAREIEVLGGYRNVTVEDIKKK